MTPKEKAKELYLKYEFVYIANYTSKHEVKQCALIAVNEIINIVPSVYLTDDEEIHSGHYQYWQQVKDEIKKL